MAKVHKEGKILDYTLAADTAAGLIVQHPSGKNGIVLGNGGVTGDVVAVNTGDAVRVANPDSVSIAAGGTVGYDQVNDKVTAAAGGTFDLGVAIYASSGAEDVVCWLN